MHEEENNTSLLQLLFSSCQSPHNNQWRCYTLGNWSMSLSYFKSIKCAPLYWRQNQALQQNVAYHSNPISCLSLLCLLCSPHWSFFFFLIASSNKPSCFLFPNLWICSSLYLECFCLHLHEASDFLSVKCQPKCHPPARPSLFTLSKACPLLVLYGIKIYFKPSINKAVWYENKWMKPKKHKT